MTDEIAIAFEDHAQQRPANEVAALETETFQRCRVAPLEVAVRIDCIDRLAGALENVCQQRLVLACDSLNLAQVRKVARRANYRYGTVILINHRLN